MSDFIVTIFETLNNTWRIVLLLVFLCGDIHTNPGPQTRNLKILHWNVNSIKTENFSRVTLIHSFNLINRYDIISISETGLHQNDSSDDIIIEGFSLYRRDLPADETHGGVLVYINVTFTTRKMPSPNESRRVEYDLSSPPTVLQTNLALQPC